jgi:hypothetical protein
VIATLDREALYGARLRGKLDGSWHGTLADVERFPQYPLHPTERSTSTV